MDVRFLLFLPTFLAAAAVATGDSFGPTIRLKVHFGLWSPGRFSRDFKKYTAPLKANFRNILTLDRPENNVCPLIVVDNVWKCDDTDDKDYCSSKGLALVAAKGQSVGKLTVYRHKFTRPTQNVVMTICAGPGVDMTKKPLRPAYFYSQKDPHMALRVNTGEKIKKLDAKWEFIASYTRSIRFEDQWSPKAKDLIKQGVATVVLAKQVAPYIWEEPPPPTSWEIPVALSNAGKENSAGEYIHGVVRRRDGTWITYLSDAAIDPRISTQLYRIALSCPEGVNGPVKIEIFERGRDADFSAYIVVYEGTAEVTELEGDDETGVKITHPRAIPLSLKLGATAVCSPVFEDDAERLTLSLHVANGTPQGMFVIGKTGQLDVDE